jgi:hypothetical protein
MATTSDGFTQPRVCRGAVVQLTGDRAKIGDRHFGRFRGTCARGVKVFRFLARCPGLVRVVEVDLHPRCRR